ncbi:hypothetical protein F4561_006562 [Lipingzhangella halophila]|uniref:UDP-N-acetylglucosamine:LPS N-acetylglucosamine transferase n=1 Tax=Lipingzhangella halophila TaxID=1783352 RepID=A0A7W7W6B3_9ACTN|nr:hypothetical protein [Lipingzhangella halophila]MBB4935653.1 hypothetical protein [Lipingzhangella halophila]
MIVFASNATGWDDQTGAMVPGGMTDAYIGPILAHLPAGSYVVDRQPHRGATNVYLAVRHRYSAGRRETGRTGVQISHGIADKSYRHGVKMRSFDHVVSPGPVHTARFIDGGVQRNRIVELGYPKLDPIYQGTVPALERDDRIRVVYAPTHGGGSERYTRGNPRAPGAGATSWWHRDTVMRLLDPDVYDVVTAWHPRHRDDRRATLAEYAGADVVIADGGSTIYEAMALGVPVVLPSWLTRDRNLEREQGRTLEARVYRDRIGYHVDRAEELPDAVKQAATQGPRPTDVEFIDGVLPPDVRGRGGKLHAQFLLDLDRR